MSDQLRDATKGKGNYGLGSATRNQADDMGRAWVGDGAKLASDEKTLVSKDGLRQYRPPTAFKMLLGIGKNTKKSHLRVAFYCY